jgi:hypothetical protein
VDGRLHRVDNLSFRDLLYLEAIRDLLLHLLEGV